MINFKLQELDKIGPWGQEPELSLHWFGLTLGDLWLSFGNETIYEYSKEAMDYWGDKQTPYNEYQLSRFIEDFTGLFNKITEPIPEALYNETRDLKKFQSNAQKWRIIYDKEEANYSDFYFNEYCNLISWTDLRTFDSAHLIGGPYLSFFRCNDRLRIVWKTEHILENGISLWTAKDGSFEMDYADFMQKIKTFGQSFFSEMGKQVELAVEKDWGKVKIDKQGLPKAHQERKDDFYYFLAFLEQETKYKTNWAEIITLFNRMTNEITNAKD